MDVLAVQLVRRKGKRASGSDCAYDLQGFAAIWHHNSRFFRRSPIRSAVLAARAMMVCVGFFSDAEGNTLPSTTYKFATSCVLQSAFTTDVRGSVPIRQPPSS